jgi:hypothetical protein
MELQRPICPVPDVLGDAHYVNLKHLAVYEGIRIEQALLSLTNNIVEGEIAKITDIADDPGSKLIVDHPKDKTSINSGFWIFYV